MNLNIQNWKLFTIGRLFDIKKGKRLTSEDQEEGDNIYVGAIDSNNGVANHISQKPIHEGNTISLSYNGSVGEAFYQPDPYWATDDVNVLYSKYKGFNQEIGLFIATVIRQNKYRFSYGRKWTLDNMKISKIRLPVQYNDNGSVKKDPAYEFSDEGYVPDWKFMEDYIKSLHCKPLTTKNKKLKSSNLQVNKWKKFQVKKLFTLLNGKFITQEEISDNPGKLAAVQSGEDNNGVIGRISLSYCKKNGYTYTTKPCLTVARTGSAGFVAFQSQGCAAGDSAKILLLDELVANKYRYLFLLTVLSANRFKYSFGRKVTEEKYLDDYIALPVQHDHNEHPVIDKTFRFSDEGYVPDWEFMDDYIKSLPYGDRI